MESMKYTIIKTKEQYIEYCNLLEELIIHNKSNDEIDLLTLLIEKWDTDHSLLNDADPIVLIKSLMEEHGLKAKDLIGILGLTKGTISKILNYQKGLSKDTIRKLSEYFKVSQEAFNRPYKLNHRINRKVKDSSLMNTRKEISAV